MFEATRLEYDHDGGVLVKALEDIQPGSLQHTDYSRYMNEITAIVKSSLQIDGTRLLLLIDAIKSCKQPCFKRDVLLEVLNKFSKDIMSSLLSNPFHDDNNRVPWKELANSIATLPDLVANCNALRRFDSFVGEKFYLELLKKLYSSLADLEPKSEVRNQQKLFYAQLIGRIAYSGYSQLVWQCFTSRVIHEDDGEFRTLLVDILRKPLHFDTRSCAQFELFIEPLYIPIFYNLNPSSRCGEYIESIMGDVVYRDETIQYMLCNKSILQTNFNRSRTRQEVMLFNIFSYLAHLNPGRVGKSLLTKTLITIVESWSNSTKILLRTYEQNRYISCALVVALRYCLDHDRDGLAEVAREIQTMVMQAFPTYLNRASSEQRNQAMCTSEIIFPAIHELIMSQPTDNNKLNFDVDWDEDCLSIKQLYCSPIEQLFQAQQAQRTETRVPSNSVKSSDELSERAVKQSDSQSDDLMSYDIDDEEDSEELEIGEELTKVPFYLHDCIDGLSQNNSARYVKLCLIKAGELISRLSEQESNMDKSIVTTDQNRLRYGKSKPSTGDAIRDIAIDLTRLLLYLDNQFDIESFEAYRLKALSSLSVAAPDLVVKYLLDNFNEPNKSIKQQLDILQVLVASAQQLSGATNDCEVKNYKVNNMNKFVKYGALYFYGIAHRLKVDFNGSGTMLPSAIVKAAVELKSVDNGCVLSEMKAKLSTPSQSKERLRERMIGERLYQSGDSQSIQMDDSYLLSRILFSISLIIKCLYHQPIMCKLSNDFVDILAAYRCHPDSGVRRAITNSLTIIRDCTPSTYFEEYLKAKTVRLFGPWLAQESELINWPRLNGNFRGT